MKMINALQAYKLIRESKGRICFAQFVKKDGTLRSMTFRTGVTKGVTGRGLSYEPEAYYMIVVYDMEKQGFRMINLKTLQTLTVSGEKTVVIG